MKKLLSTISFVFFLISLFAQTNYYVSLSGDNNNTGLSEAQAWRTITYAASTASPVSAGDIVHVKSGDYGAENIVFEKDGTSAQPIVFEGYQTTPGDNPVLNYTLGDALDANLMPLLDGGNRATSGVAIDLEPRSYLTVKNFQIEHYQVGVYARRSNYLSLDNIIAIELGDIVDDDYDGTGFSLAPNDDGVGGNNNTLQKCIVTNAGAEGISIVGNDNSIVNCKVYCNENTAYASSDYYIVIAGNDNTVSDCYIERVGDLDHGGAGIGVKDAGENNLFENCVAKDLKNGCFYVRYRAAKNNEFRNCHAIGTLADVNGFLIRDGASYNTFNNCFSENCTSAIVFLDTDEDDGAQYCGRYNVFNNCIVQNSTWAVGFVNYSVESPADYNSFMNCNFINGDYLTETERTNSDNKMINCIVSGFSNLQTGAYSLGMDFTYSDFDNNGFSAPAGTGNISDDPLFVDAANADYHLQSISPCVDAGTATDAPNTDYEGTARPQGVAFDIGAFEWSGALPVTLIDFVLSPLAHCQGVRLNWVTETEINSKVFELERSLDLRTWESLAGVEAKGESVERVNYIFEDRLAPKNRLLYYRFKEIDWDGRYFYSPIESIQLDCKNAQVHVYPNPCTDKLTIETSLQGDFEIRRIDGNRVMSGHVEKEIDISPLVSGVYFLKIWLGNQIFVERLLVD